MLSTVETTLFHTRETCRSGLQWGCPVPVCWGYRARFISTVKYSIIVGLKIQIDFKSYIRGHMCVASHPRHQHP
jgi:hypothetical protein